MLVDSHCHLNYEGLIEDQPGVLARAREAGVGAFLNISTRQSEWQAVVATAEREPDVWASIGIHPHEAEQHADLGEAVLLEAAVHPKVIGIGESGLDYYYDKSDRAVQRALFRTHIAVARKTGLPLIVHTRDAEEDTLAILAEEMERGAFPALIHCFTASAEFGHRVLELGLTISLSGIVTSRMPASCSTSLRRSRPIACWSRPTAPSLRPCLIAARPASRPTCAARRNSSPISAERASRRWRTRPHATSTRSSGRRPREAGGARLRDVDRRAAHRQ